MPRCGWLISIARHLFADLDHVFINAMLWRECFKISEHVALQVPSRLPLILKSQLCVFQPLLEQRMRWMSMAPSRMTSGKAEMDPGQTTRWCRGGWHFASQISPS